MTILYVGNYKQPWCTEVHVANTLESLGHEVIRMQEDTLLPGELVDEAVRNKPDLVLWTRTWQGKVTLHDIEKLRSLGFITVSYHLDLYIGLQRQEGLDTDAFWRTDYVFTPDGDPYSSEVFRDKGINHHWLKPGVYDAECIPGRVRDEFRGKIAFIGSTVNYHSEWPYREELVHFLQATYGGWFQIYGPPFRGVRGQDLNDVLASTDIIVGDTLCPGYTHEGYWSDRIYEVTGRGGFIIHPRIKGLETEFKEHEEVAFYNYGDFEHLRRLIDWYLEHGDYREAVRKNGMQRTINEHTYKHRVKELLGMLK